jgi:hypothetical protein
VFKIQAQRQAAGFVLVVASLIATAVAAAAPTAARTAQTPGHHSTGSTEVKGCPNGPVSRHPGGVLLIPPCVVSR